MSYTDCPYCGKEIEIDNSENEDCESDVIHQQECDCGKTFTYTTYIHFCHTSERADCLNGGVHNFKKTHTFPPECARIECTICGEPK